MNATHSFRPGARFAGVLASLALAAAVCLPDAASARVISTNSDVGGHVFFSSLPLPFLGSCNPGTAAGAGDFGVGQYADACLGAVGTPEDAGWVRLLGARPAGSGQWVSQGTDTQVVAEAGGYAGSTAPGFNAGSSGRGLYFYGPPLSLLQKLQDAPPEIRDPLLPMRIDGTVAMAPASGSFIVALSGTWLRDTEGPDGLVTDHWSSYYRFDDVDFAPRLDAEGKQVSPAGLDFSLVNRFNQQRVEQVSIYRFEPAAPVPEPASAALMLAGVSLVAAAALRRRSR